ncbi:MAG: hypothetical protein WCQ62_10485, partial [Sphaerochaeta sp.]
MLDIASCCCRRTFVHLCPFVRRQLAFKCSVCKLEEHGKLAGIEPLRIDLFQEMRKSDSPLIHPYGLFLFFV